MERIAHFSVDVDGLDLYYKIHGLTPSRDTPSIYQTGFKRFLELFREMNIRATFFVVAQDALVPENREMLVQAVKEGHELASHSLTHPYDLIRMDETTIRREVVESERILSDIRGSRTVGFRAPGYNTSPLLLHILEEEGYAYDSSFFPCPPYYFAKAGVLGAYRILGKKSASILGDPKVLLARRHPHALRPGEDFLEFPITVTPGIRFPVIGTAIIAGGHVGWKGMEWSVRRTPFVQIEFHAIDLTDHKEDGISDILLRQPDQKVPLTQKWDLFKTVIADLKRDRRVETLESLTSDRTWMTAN